MNRRALSSVPDRGRPHAVDGVGEFAAASPLFLARALHFSSAAPSVAVTVSVAPHCGTITLVASSDAAEPDTRITIAPVSSPTNEARTVAGTPPGSRSCASVCRSTRGSASYTSAVAETTSGSPNAARRRSTA